MWNPETAKKCQQRDDTLRREADRTVRLFRADEQATAAVIIRVSWGKLAFEYERRVGATYIIADEATIRQTPAVCEVSRLDYHPERPSPQRLSQRWGQINEHLFYKKEGILLHK
jgi:hypothetical protein